MSASGSFLRQRFACAIACAMSFRRFLCHLLGLAWWRLIASARYMHR
jgi:hypothetical protein